MSEAFAPVVLELPELRYSRGRCFDPRRQRHRKGPQYAQKGGLASLPARHRHSGGFGARATDDHDDTHDDEGDSHEAEKAPSRVSEPAYGSGHNQEPKG